jgi:hypothetical protein
MAQELSSLGGVVLLAFYLYLLVRWQYVRRPMWYLVGVASQVAFGILCGIFVAANLPRVALMFAILDSSIAFAAIVLACYGAELPVKLTASLNQMGMSSQATAAAAAPSQPAPPPSTGNPSTPS